MGKIFNWIFQKEEDTSGSQVFINADNDEGECRVQAKFDSVKSYYNWRIVDKDGIPLMGVRGVSPGPSGAEWTKEACVERANQYLVRLAQHKKNKNAKWEDI